MGYGISKLYVHCKTREWSKRVASGVDWIFTHTFQDISVTICKLYLWANTPAINLSFFANSKWLLDVCGTEGQRNQSTN